MLLEQASRFPCSLTSPARDAVALVICTWTLRRCVKCLSQFRIKFADISMMYARMENSLLV